MNKHLYTYFLVFLFSITANAQEKTSLETSSQDFNRWTIEAMTGFSDGNYP